ncbi:MAG: hypothetical protein ACP5GJ_02610 [Nanopusillaceae archaeon]
MIVKSSNRYYFVQNRVARDILSKLSDRRYYNISMLQDVIEKYGRKKVYDTIKLLSKYGLIEIKKNYLGRIYFRRNYYKSRIFDILLSINIILSTMIYILAHQIISYSNFLSLYGLLIGVISSISILLLFILRKIYDDSVVI